MHLELKVTNCTLDVGITFGEITVWTKYLGLRYGDAGRSRYVGSFDVH